MKYVKKYTFFFSTIILFLILLIPSISANPVPPTPQDISISYLFTCVAGFFLTIVCEFGIGFIMIRKARTVKPFFIKTIFSVNAITYPLTQLIVYFFALITLPMYLIYVILLIEVFVIVSEWFLVTTFFKRKRDFALLGENNSIPYLFIYSLIANMVTYLIGLLLINGWGMYNMVSYI